MFAWVSSALAFTWTRLQLQGRRWKEFYFFSPVKSGSSRRDLVRDLRRTPTAGRPVAAGSSWPHSPCPMLGHRCSWGSSWTRPQKCPTHPGPAGYRRVAGPCCSFPDLPHFLGLE